MLGIIPDVLIGIPYSALTRTEWMSDGKERAFKDVKVDVILLSERGAVHHLADFYLDFSGMDARD